MSFAHGRASKEVHMTDETRDIEAQSPFFSGWRKAALWLVGAGALAVVGYRGALGSEAPAASLAPAAASAAESQASPHPPATAATGAAPASSATAAASDSAARPEQPLPPARARPAVTAEGADTGAPAASGSHAEPAPPAAGITPDGKVVLNLATESELRKLPGIGKSRARAIVEQRERLGRFRRLEDLLRVKGIGPKRLAVIRTRLVLDAP
jgi:competence protein ComEA